MLRDMDEPHGFEDLFANPRMPLPPFVVVLGPDPVRSYLLFVLLAHLASLAGLNDADEGGTVLGSMSVHLQEALVRPPDIPDGWVTYRLAFGKSVPAPPMVRLIHTMWAGSAPGRTSRRLLAGAGELWLVAPAEDAHLSHGLVAAVGAGAAGEKLVLICDGAPAEGTGVHQVREPPWANRRVALCLSSIRDRIIAGRMAPPEAASLIRMLLGAEETPPAPSSVFDGAAEGRSS